MHPSLWVRESAELPPSPPLPAAVEVAVIGGGIAGVSTALWLARAGAEVCLLERAAVADRASGRNDGQLLLGLGEHYNRIVGQLGKADARRLWDSICANNDELKREIRAAGIPCDLRQGGGLRLAETAHEHSELREAAELLAAEGIAHELLDPGGVRARLPLAEGFHGALHLPGEAVVQPAAMVRGLARAAQAAGAAVIEGVEVIAVDGDTPPRTLHLADGRTLRAHVVVHCTSVLAPRLDGSGFLARNLFPFRGQIVATEPLPDELAHAFPPAAMSSNFCYEYFRLHGRRFVVGGMRWSVPGEESGTTDDGDSNPQVSANLLRWVARHFPALAAVPFPHCWTGIMAGTPDGLPLCGALPGQPGVFALCGFNGYGLSFAFLAGRTVAEQVLEGRASDPAAPLFAPRRFA